MYRNFQIHKKFWKFSIFLKPWARTLKSTHYVKMPFKNVYHSKYLIVLPIKHNEFLISNDLKFHNQSNRKLCHSSGKSIISPLYYCKICFYIHQRFYINDKRYLMSKVQIYLSLLKTHNSNFGLSYIIQIIQKTVHLLHILYDQRHHQSNARQ